MKSLPALPIALLAIFSLAGCTESSKWGPLAVTDSEDVNMMDGALGGTGRLVIGDDCVYLETDGSRGATPGVKTTLAWRSGQVSWDGESETIRFSVPGGQSFTLSNGDRITVGGGGGWRRPSAIDGSSKQGWLARPSESCPTRGFHVHDVDVHESARP